MKTLNLKNVMACLYALDFYVERIKTERRIAEIETVMTWFETYEIGKRIEAPIEIFDTAKIALRAYRTHCPNFMDEDIKDALERL